MLVVDDDDDDDETTCRRAAVPVLFGEANNFSHPGSDDDRHTILISCARL